MAAQATVPEQPDFSGATNAPEAVPPASAPTPAPVLSETVEAERTETVAIAPSDYNFAPLDVEGAKAPTSGATQQAPPIPDDLLPNPDTLLAANDPSGALPGDPGPAAGSGELITSSAASATPTGSVVVNLINRLVEKGVFTKEEASDLVAQAEADAEIAQRDTIATQTAIAQTQATQSAMAEVISTQVAPPPAEGEVRVTYVPEVVRKQIRSQIKDEVMAQARLENWAAPGILPDWIGKVDPFADFRFRFQADAFPSGNDATGAFPNFNAINTGAPFDVTGDQFAPQLNTDQDRYRLRLRVRLGAGIDLGENFSAGFRLATGDSNSPTSTNQTIGKPDDGQGGNFSKYAIWLDRAFLSYTLGDDENHKLGILVGRFDNPFFTTSSIVWDDDIGFDGIAGVARYRVFDRFTPFLVGGAFPVYNTDFNFASNQPVKFESYDKYLFAVQGGLETTVTKDIEVTTALAYYYFQNIEGQLSDPYVPLSASDAGNTDASRPSFAQKGNTYMALRNITPTEANNFGTTDQYQYFGLATPYQVLAFSGRIDYTRWEPFTISLLGDYVNNLAFDSSAINAKAVNNRGPIPDNGLSDSVGAFVGGSTAWSISLQIGAPQIAKRWDWNMAFGYRYVESDAVVDGFTESDFGGGGTNLKGFTVGGNLALSSNVWLGIRWMTAESIAGPTFKTDVFQFDLNARF